MSDDKTFKDRLAVVSKEDFKDYVKECIKEDPFFKDLVVATAGATISHMVRTEKEYELLLEHRERGVKNMKFCEASWICLNTLLLFIFIAIMLVKGDL